MNQVMVDIETLGRNEDAAIISIGACMFDPYKTGQIGDTFERNIEFASNEGRNVDPDTVAWWFRQSKEAQLAAIAQPSVPLKVALMDFIQWLPGRAKIWSNGPTFDEAILRHAFKQHKLNFPIAYWDSRCVRTANAFLKFQGVAKPTRKGEHHNALDDAIFQAECVMRAFRGRE